ncbi:MAG: hypothetical protein KAS69_01755 [Planctomycetes bacterium]|nr:hypothetical protein [Planctomycetota bacterium]
MNVRKVRKVEIATAKRRPRNDIKKVGMWEGGESGKSEPCHSFDVAQDRSDGRANPSSLKLRRDRPKTQYEKSVVKKWIPAFAGMTKNTIRYTLHDIRNTK